MISSQLLIYTRIPLNVLFPSFLFYLTLTNVYSFFVLRYKKRTRLDNIDYSHVDMIHYEDVIS